MNEKSEVTQERLYSEERRSTRNHERRGKIAEKHRGTETADKEQVPFMFLRVKRSQRHSHR
jgi:hypothetical protein